MKLGCAVVILVCAVSAASATTVVDLGLDTLAANGWKATTTAVYHAATNATITESSDYGASSFRFYTGPMNTSWQFQWAGLSTEAFAGSSLASITSLKIRNFGAFGDNVNKWQPPTFTFVVNKGDGNQRCITWRPWADGPRDALKLVWNDFDAATEGRWYVEETNTYYDSLALLQAALPNATFEPTGNLPTDWGYASQQAFNVGFCPLYDGDRSWFSNTAGYVDWFEVGVNGNVTRYNLVPEPAALAMLMMGAVLLRRR